MSVFAYNPDSARTWANSVIEYLNGGGESINSCSKKFNEQLETLVQPNVWTGDAALKNYQNFLETHQALIQFINSFGQAFEEAMNSVSSDIAEMENRNLGTDSNVANLSLNYAQLSELSESNIRSDEVRYDYEKISSIGEALKNIRNELESVSSSLKKKIEELNNGSSIWDGNAAENAKENLSNCLNTNMQKALESLDVCINNIKVAADNARALDN